MDRPLNKLLSQMALELADTDTSAATVDTVAQYARIAVNGDDAGVMLVHARNKVETPAGTSKDVDKAHQLQAEYDEGPCLAAIEGGDEIYVVANTLGDERWPTWGKAAADLGYFSVVSASLETGSRRIGSLNVYSRSMDAFDDSDAEVVGLLAGHASVAIAASNTRHQLQRALGTRTLIGQAEGILMHAFDIDSAKAFAYLQRLSQDQNVKLVRIAETIIENKPDIGRSDHED
jgi:GAF domain-containing protein